MFNKTRYFAPYFYVLIGAAILGCSAPIEYDPTKHYRITGDVTGYTDDWIDAKFLVKQRTYDENGDPTVLTLAETNSSDGKFVIVGEIVEPTAVSVFVENDGKSGDRAEMVIEVGADLTVSYPNKTVGMVADGGGIHGTLISTWQFSDEYQTAIDVYGDLLEKKRAAEEAAENDSEGAEEQASSAVDENETTPQSQEINTADLAAEETQSSAGELANASSDTEEAADSSSETEEEVDEMYEAYRAVMDIRQTALDSFAMDDENPELALLAIELGALDPKKAIVRLDELRPSFTEESVAKRITPRRARLVAYQEKVEADESLGVGESAPAFTAPALAGADVSLHSVLADNQVVLLDFWASWCGPCIKTFPHLKELHATYGDQGFEIVSVSIDDTNEDWDEASEEHELPWINLGDISKSDGPVSSAYGVTFIPKGYVLDSNGVIIAKDIKTEDLEELLASKLSSDKSNSDLGMTSAEVESETEQGS